MAARQGSHHLSTVLYVNSVLTVPPSRPLSCAEPPQALTAPAGAGTKAAESAEGQAALVEAVSQLRLRYVGWAHRAHEEAARKAAALGAEGSRQAQQLAALRARAAAAAAAGAALAAGLARAEELQGVLLQRCRLVADLARQAPRPLSAPDAAAAAQLAQLHSHTVPVLHARLLDSQKRAAAVASATAAAPATVRGAALPQQQLERLQAALAHCGAVIEDNVAKAKLVQQGVLGAGTGLESLGVEDDDGWLLV